tara:strand:+ start:8444 stop:8785 length:342 start_codon:yes stop_codon:yes gene_type:complete
MASLDQENMYAPKRGVSGEFAANPRVMAHDSVDIHTLGVNNQIPGTGNPRRGAALYCGVAFTNLEVILEGQVGTSNTTVLKGISAGSFLPLLVVEVITTTPTLGGTGQLVALL